MSVFSEICKLASYRLLHFSRVVLEFCRYLENVFLLLLSSLLSIFSSLLLFILSYFVNNMLLYIRLAAETDI